MNGTPTIFSEETVRIANEAAARAEDLGRLVDTLTSDLIDVVNTLHSDFERSSTRRHYVRAVGAMVEGGISAMSAYFLDNGSLAGWTFTDDELLALSDGAAETGSKPTVGKRPRLIDRTKSVFIVGRRIFEDAAIGDFGGAGFQSFRLTIKIRDRLMHPKRSPDLNITVDDLATVDRGRDWFRREAQRLFLAAGAEARARVARWRASSSASIRQTGTRAPAP